jgi:hypothetical protein
MRDLVERLRAKPEHIRRRIALFSSAGITGVVGLAWLAATVNTGALALSKTPPTQLPAPSDNGSTLIGAAAAFQGPKDDATIRVEDVKPQATQKQDTRTVIPF